MLVLLMCPINSRPVYAMGEDEVRGGGGDSWQKAAYFARARSLPCTRCSPPLPFLSPLSCLLSPSVAPSLPPSLPLILPAPPSLPCLPASLNIHPSPNI